MKFDWDYVCPYEGITIVHWLIDGLSLSIHDIDLSLCSPLGFICFLNAQNNRQTPRN